MSQACRGLAAPLLLILLLSPAAAQFNTGSLKVRVTFTDGRHCNFPVRVQLMSAGSTSPLTEAYTNDAGMTEFNNIEVGNYHLIVSGQGIEETDSEAFEVDNRRPGQFQYVVVKRAADANKAAESEAGPSPVAAADMNIPPRAAKEFDKATELIAKQDWKKAIERLNKALAVYPHYASAYNNLGIVYGRMGDRARERETLLKAVALNDHFAPALVNLARMAITDHDFPAAEAYLDKATGMDPANSQALILLANVELLDHHYDQAIASCRKAHSLAQEAHALVHYIAARAFEHQSRPTEAAAEFQTFLTEEPSGGRADSVRKELSSLQRQLP